MKPTIKFVGVQKNLENPKIKRDSSKHKAKAKLPWKMAKKKAEMKVPSQKN